jgi:hypothetical protein
MPIGATPNHAIAPWDGEDYLVYGPHGHDVQVAYWDVEHSRHGYGWGTLDGPYYPNTTFTHWQRRPEKPVQP